MSWVQLPTRKVFKSEVHQHQLEQEGYVKLQALGEKQISELLAIYEKGKSPELDHPFYTSNWSADIDYRKKIDAQVRPILEEALAGLFQDYKCMFGYFLVKRPSAESMFRVHQDWTMVDESNFTGLTAWFALTDTTVENGCFHVVKKSHLFSDHVRGSEIVSPYCDIQDEIEKEFCTPLEVKKGEVVLFDHRLWHYSPPNFSKQDRVAAGMVLIPSETTFVHYHLNTGSGKLSTFKADDDFLINTGFGDDIASKGYELVAEKDFQQSQLDFSEFKNRYYKFNPESNSSWSIKSLLERIGA